MYKSFLDMEPPPGYVPGVGRGATGFTTRSDLGTAVRGGGEGGENEGGENTNERYQDAEDDSGLFAGRAGDADDDEADRVFAAIENRMKEKNQANREKREREQREQRVQSSKEIADQFAPEKRQLAELTVEDWAAIPEAVDITRKNKRRRLEQQANRRTYATPDSLIADRQARTGASSLTNAIDPNSVEEDENSVTDFQALSHARDTMLKMKLDQIGGGGSGSGNGSDGTVDTNEALEKLSKVDSGKIQDTEKAKLIFKKIIKEDPRNVDTYISYARLEERSNRISKAKRILDEACQNNPKSEEVWMESIRLETDRSNARALAKRATDNCKRSVKLWLKYLELQDHKTAKISIIQAAIHEVSDNEQLWMAYVDLQEDDTNSRRLLEYAVKQVPSSEQMWLHLARLEPDSKRTKSTLNKARKALRTSRAVWIAAAKVEEESGKPEQVDKVMERGVAELLKENGLPSRDEWIRDAFGSESEGSILTCHAIIKATVGQGLEDDVRMETWLQDGGICIEQGKFETCRAIYAHALRTFPTDEPLWLATTKLEHEHGTRESLLETLDKAVDACPSNSTFWLMYIHELSVDHQLHEARKVLARGFKANPNNDDLWVAAVDLEVENDQIDQARQLLKAARDNTDSQRVWVRSVLFERQQKNTDVALELVDEGLKRHPTAAKLYMQKGQLYELRDDKQSAQQAYSQGTRQCRESVPLWLLSAKLEQNRGMAIKARSILDSAALLHDSDERVWLARVRLEKSVQNESQAKALLAQALQKCPTSGPLWCEHIWSQQRIKRRGAIADAIRASQENAIVLCTGARTFWESGKNENAQKWFEHAIKKDPDYGDIWLWYYKFLTKTGKTNEAEVLLDKFLKSRPKHGEIWVPVLKDVDNYRLPWRDLFMQALNKL